jgi:hypothetical protein
MPRKKVIKPAEVVNPDQLPDFQPPMAIVPVPLEEDLEASLLALLDLSSEGDGAARKAMGYYQIACELNIQRRRMALAVARMAQEVHDYDLWKFYPGDEFGSEEAFWAATGWRFSEVRQLLAFYRQAVPVMNAAGIDAEEVYEKSGDAALAAITRTAKRLTREGGGDITSIPLDDRTRETVREAILSFVGQTDGEVRRLEKMARSEPLKMPAYVTMNVVVTPNGPRLQGTFSWDLATVEGMRDGTAFLKWMSGGYEANFTKMASLMESAVNAQPAGAVVFGEDESDMFEEFDLAS